MPIADDQEDTPPPQRQPRSPFAWLLDWLTEEVAPQEPETSDAEQPRAEPVPVLRRMGPTPARRRWVRRRQPPYAVVGVAAAVLLAVVAIVIAHRPTVASPHYGTATPSVAHSVSKASKAASTSPSASATVTATVPAGSPDCSAMKMTAVPPAAGATAQAVAGLCASVGNGDNWLVGCAPGFQASCAPALQPVITCLFAANKDHPIATADVQTCAARVEAQLSSSGAGTG